jgi:hypothetical protein
MKRKARAGKYMSKRSGDKTKSSRDKKKRRRQRNQELRKAAEENKTAGREAPDPARNGDRIVSSQLRRLTRDSKDGSDQDAGVLEIVVYRIPGSAE